MPEFDSPQTDVNSGWQPASLSSADGGTRNSSCDRAALPTLRSPELPAEAGDPNNTLQQPCKVR